MKKSYLYVSILGFNLLVISLSLIGWYYFADFIIGGGMSPSHPNDKSQVFDDNKLSKFPWVRDMITKYGGLVEICSPFHGGPCGFTLTPMRLYEVNSVIDTLQLQKLGGGPFDKISDYHTWFTYDGRYYEITLRVLGDYTDYVFYGISSSAIGTLGLVLVWTKLQSRIAKQAGTTGKTANNPK